MITTILSGMANLSAEGWVTIVLGLALVTFCIVAAVASERSK